jgi:hypothetical protein
LPGFLSTPAGTVTVTIGGGQEQRVFTEGVGVVRQKNGDRIHVFSGDANVPVTRQGGSLIGKADREITDGEFTGLAGRAIPVNDPG